MKQKGFHRLMEEFVFNQYVERHYGLEQTLSNLYLFLLEKKEQINRIFFTNSYCTKYVTKLWHKFDEKSAEKRNGFIKKGSLRETILEMFARKGRTSIFLAQKNIAKAYGCSQKTVSFEIRKMKDEEIIKDINRRHWRWHRINKMAVEYILLEKGIELVGKMASSFSKFLQKRDYFLKLAKSLVKEKEQTEQEKLQEEVKRNKKNQEDFWDFCFSWAKWSIELELKRSIRC